MMKRSNSLSRKTGLKPAAQLRLEPERPLAIWCEIQLAGCLGRAAHRHERKRRAQGGDGSRENTIDVCSACHRWIHDHPSAAYGKGYLVEHWRNPGEVPVSVSPNVLRYLGVEE